LGKEVGESHGKERCFFLEGTTTIYSVPWKAKGGGPNDCGGERGRKSVVERGPSKILEGKGGRRYLSGEHSFRRLRKKRKWLKNELVSRKRWSGSF